jgi:hypothetical protein
MRLKIMPTMTAMAIRMPVNTVKTPGHAPVLPVIPDYKNCMPRTGEQGRSQKGGGQESCMTTTEAVSSNGFFRIARLKRYG